MSLSVPQPSSRWWAEKEFWLLLVSLIVILTVRLDDTPFRGEEPRRAEVVAEMRYFHDWFVPRQYGRPFLSRPPVHAWTIAAAEELFQSRARWVLRLPSALSVLLTSLLLYGYGRQFLTRVGATTAALAYPTCGEVMVQSQLAETEPLFILFLAASLIFWHWGYVAKWRSAFMWSAAYGCSALAGLTKGGLQPEVYLLGSIGLYLLWKRDLRSLFSWGHLIGLAVAMAIVAAWAMPCASIIGWEQTKKCWMSDTAMRFADWRFNDFLLHLVSLPAALFGSLLPWGLLGGAFLLPGFRRSIFTGPDCILFCGLGFLVAFPTIWIPPGGETRYLAPIYPCLAILYGAAVDWFLQARLADSIWQRFLSFWAATLATFGVLTVTSVLILPGTQFQDFSLRPVRAAAYAAIALAVSIILMISRRAMTARSLGSAVWALAAGAIVVNLGAVTDTRISRANDLEAAMGDVKACIPPDEVVYVVHGIYPPVPYLLYRPSPVHEFFDWNDVPPGGYFFMPCNHHVLMEVPFEWEHLAEVCVERIRNATPEFTVVLARRKGSIVAGVAKAGRRPTP